ncbi:hypothetical protein ACGFNU_28185 [Spirillospora sp. NPDC048911]|uniref:hypothetical protein n=1 Tax=Spirillospora sp. NPDC048911 TaxID=3364527 RepID=UPI0037131364
MTIRGWQRAVVIGGLGAMAISPAGAAVADETPVMPGAAATGVAQKLPPGYYIQGTTLYNAQKKAIALPAGWTINAGVIYDGDDRVVSIEDGPPEGTVSSLSGMTTATAPPVEECPQQPKAEMKGVLSSLVGEVVCLLGSLTRAVFGPEGLLSYHSPDEELEADSPVLGSAPAELD